jgi:uncharacterized phosphosugar-binding protein
MSFQYLDKIYSILQEVSVKEKQNIDIAVNIFVDKIKNKQQIFAFGASHAGILTQELFYRAGGLVVINPIFESSLMLDTRPVTKTSQMERLQGYGTIIANNCAFKSGDLLIVHSVSGRNPVAIDLVLSAKAKGVTVIAITNVKYSSSVTSRHNSGKRLFEIANHVIDNHGELGDACVEVKGLQQKVAPTSTVIGATILNIIVSETVKDLVSKNIDPPVFFSANVDGGDEHNKKILAEYKNVIHYQ